MDLTQLTATEAAEATREGKISAEELVAACLERVCERESAVEAWAYLDPQHALRQARERDQVRKAGGPLGALHGVPVGVQDIFDTFDMPTENGTALHSGRQPTEDAAAVALLRQAGAVILGKTVTTELAALSPGRTRNPRDPARTPGGSSSGSAAAVADAMVPLALGAQANGSVIQPAAFCGAIGYKPTHGLISRHRLLPQSRRLDQIGVFARSVEDAALVAEQLMSYDERDPDMRPRGRPPLAATATAPPPLPPRLGFVRTPVWEQAEPDTHTAFAELVERLGDAVEEYELPAAFGQAVTWHRAILESDLARSLDREYRRGRDRLSPVLRETLERGQQVRAVDYLHAREQIGPLNALLQHVFDRYDAIVTPAVPGEAPLGLASTGSPIFCTVWTLCGTPAVSLPLFEGSRGLPMGAQLVAARGDDARLLRTARWLVRTLAASTVDSGED